MDAVVKKSTIQGSIIIPPSKSQAHRIMIATFLAGGDFDFNLVGDDVEATKNCLAQINNYLNEGRCKAWLDVGESGSTLRFLLPIVCALDITAEFHGCGRLAKRPIGELVEVLRAHGANILGDELPLRTLPSQGEVCKARGGLRAGEYRINGEVSSQYITGLLFALPLLEGDSEIVVEGELVSSAYVDMTLDVLARFGVEIKKTSTGFFVKGGQRFKAAETDIEGDWSSACFPLALGLLTGEVRAKGLKSTSLQADRVFFDLAKRMGGDISFDGDAVVARKSALKGIDFDATGCPDIVPITAVLLGFASGKSRIMGVDRLRAKESDRLVATMELLKKFGADAIYKDNSLEIIGNGLANGESFLSGSKETIIDGYADHRIAMSGVVGGLFVGETIVEGVECMAKSYPSFLNDIEEIGANVRVKK